MVYLKSEIGNQKSEIGKIVVFGKTGLGLNLIDLKISFYPKIDKLKNITSHHFHISDFLFFISL